MSQIAAGSIGFVWVFMVSPYTRTDTVARLCINVDGGGYNEDTEGRGILDELSAALHDNSRHWGRFIVRLGGLGESQFHNRRESL